MERFRKLLDGIFFLFVLLVAVFLSLDLDVLYQNSALILVCNTLFTGLIPIAVAVLCSSAYLSNGNRRALLMGCGMLLLGLGSILSGTLGFILNSNNTMITIYNICTFASAVYHLLAVTPRKPARLLSPTGRNRRLTLALVGVVLFSGVVAWLAGSGYLPVFFDQTGSSRLRNILLL